MTGECSGEPRKGGLAAWNWAFVLALAALALLRIFDVIGNLAAHVGAIAVICCAIPLAISANRRAREKGCTSPALERYNKGIAVTSVAYVVGLGVAMVIYKNHELSLMMRAAITLLPVVPTLALIRVVVRYVGDETDEYLRHRFVMASLAGIATVLVLGTVWGFLEVFAVVPHVWAWWVLPVWAIGMGVYQFWTRERGA